MATTSIEWTDKVWNPVTGCSKISPGCKNCYAETIANRFWKDRKFTDVQCHEDRLEQPIHWKKPSRIFVNSMSDLFHEKVPAKFITDCFSVMEVASWHTFQVLTKRPQRFEPVLFDEEGCFYLGAGDYIPNIWLGVSVEDKDTLWRIDKLREIQYFCHFVSFEPLLEDVGTVNLEGVDWVIVGGESGPHARPFDIEWARSIRDQCKERGISFFMKQLGSNCIWHTSGRGKRDDSEEWPEDIRIREFPQPEKEHKNV